MALQRIPLADQHRQGGGGLQPAPLPSAQQHVGQPRMQAHGGLVTTSDVARYEVVPREPVRGTYRGHEIVSFPPPSSGGVHVVEILNMLERFDLTAMGDGSADFAHVVVEAMKLAFADRARWLGDPDFAHVPRGLVSKEYAAALAQRIRLDRASVVAAAGSPPGADRDWFTRERNRHTTHFSTADTEGNWVACTASLNTSFGSKVVVPGTGVLLNNHMDDFSAQPGVPNYFGLVGAEANAIEARKRPLSSMSPTLVLRDGQPILSVGAAGGPTIISQTLLAILRVIDFKKSPREALAAPRLHHQWKPDELHAELRQQVRVEIGPIASPDHIHFTTALPKTRSGKIMRRILRKIAENDFGALGDTSTLADPNVVDALIEGRQNR